MPSLVWRVWGKQQNHRPDLVIEIDTVACRVGSRRIVIFNDAICSLYVLNEWKNEELKCVTFPDNSVRYVSVAIVVHAVTRCLIVHETCCCEIRKYQLLVMHFKYIYVVHKVYSNFYIVDF